MSSRRPLAPLRRLAALALIVLALTAGATAASAHEDDEATTTTVDLKAKAAEVASDDLWALQGGMEVQGATLTCPGEAAVTMKSKRAAAFMEVTVANAMFGTPELKEPPAGTPICKIDVRYRNDPSGPFAVLSVNWAEADGKSYTQSPPQKWFVALPAATKAVHDETAVPVNGHDPSLAAPATTTTVPKADEPAAKADDDDSSPLVPILIGGAVIGAALIGAVVIRQRRTAKAKQA